MPFGISESAIKGAYGPIDYSGFYKGIDAAVKRSSEQDKLEKKQALQEYTKLSNTLNETKTGVASIDLDDINLYKNNFKSAALPLANNPNMIDTHFERYKKLSGESNQNFKNTEELIKQSQERTDYFKKIYTPSVLAKLSDEGKAKVDKLSKMTTRQIMSEGGLPSLDEIMFQGTDLNKLFADIDTKVVKPSIDNKSKIVVNKQKGKLPNTYVGDLITDVVRPDELIGRMNRYVDGLKNNSKVAEQYLTQAINSGEVKRLYDEYNNISDEELARYKINGQDLYPEHIGPDGKKTRKLSIPYPTGTTTGDFKNVLLVSSLLNNKPTTRETDKEFYPNGKEVVQLQTADINRKSNTEEKKKYALWAKQNITGNSALSRTTAGIFTLLNIGNTAAAQAALDELPNGFDNGVFVYGAPVDEYKSGYKGVAIKLLGPGATEEKINNKIAEIQKMSSADLSKQLGIPEADLKNGITTSSTKAADKEGNYQTKIFQTTPKGVSEFGAFNLSTFGTKAKNTYLEDQASQFDKIFELGTSVKEREVKVGSTKKRGKLD